MVKFLGLCTVQLFAVLVHHEEVFGGGCRFDTVTFALWSRLGEVSQDAVDVVKHRHFDSALHAEVQCHSQILVDLPMVHSHPSGPIFEHAFVFVTKSINELVVGLGINAGYHAIINVEAASLLFSFDRSIANAPVIRVEFEAVSFEGLHELIVVEEAGNDRSVNGILTLQNQLLLALLVETDKLFVIQIYFAEHVHQISSDSDDGHVFFILNLGLDERVWDVDYRNAPSFFSSDHVDEEHRFCGDSGRAHILLGDVVPLFVSTSHCASFHSSISLLLEEEV